MSCTEYGTTDRFMWTWQKKLERIQLKTQRKYEENVSYTRAENIRHNMNMFVSSVYMNTASYNKRDTR